MVHRFSNGVRNHLVKPAKNHKLPFEHSPGGIISQRHTGCACGGSCPRCQSRGAGELTITGPNDRYEREADQAAGRILNLSEQSSPERDRADTPVPTAGQSHILIHQHFPQLSNSGSPLTADSQQFYSQALDYDFSQVRVHTGNPAESAASHVRARAFTLGNDVVFNRGEYNPHSHEGKRILAHELTHVVQQNRDPGLNQVSPVLQRTEMFADCESDQIGGLWTAWGRARDDMQSAILPLSALVRSEHVNNALWIYYRDNSDETALNAAEELRNIVSRMDYVYFECEQPGDTGYDMFCEGDEDIYGYVFGATLLTGEGDIHLCMGNWDDAGIEQRARTIVHELSHYLLATADDAYFTPHDCHETEGSAETADRHGNADSLACLVHAITRMSAQQVANRVDYYHGNQFVVSQSPQGQINLDDDQQIVFRVSLPPRVDDNAILYEVPASPAFGFRWVLMDSEHNRYELENTFTNESASEYGQHVSVVLTDETRVRLREQGLSRAMLYCRIRLPVSGSKLIWMQVHFTTE